MKPISTVKVATPSDREVTVARTFDAPRGAVFDAFTKPEIVEQWLWGPDEWPMVRCAIDLKVGGAYRYVWRNKEKGDMAMGGVFREIDAPRRIVHTELFDEDWTGGETVVTTLFEESDGRTTVTATVLYSTKEARDGAIETPMIEGWAMSYDRLDRFLAGAATRR
jgi:uncharacterized protein YndB with AHSA1/START domain